MAGTSQNKSGHDAERVNHYEAWYNGPSKDVLFKIAHTAGLPHQAVGYSCFFLILAGRLAAVTADAPATDVLNIAQTT